MDGMEDTTDVREAVESAESSITVIPEVDSVVVRDGVNSVAVGGGWTDVDVEVGAVGVMREF